MTRKLSLFAAIFLAIVLVFLLVVPTLTATVSDDKDDAYVLDIDKEYYEKYKGQNKRVVVYNWGEYISDGQDNSMNVNKAFTEATGIEVTYLTFSTNEELYAKLKSGNSAYDIIIPSDYMIGRMIEENMLTQLDKNLLPNLPNIDEQFVNPIYDPESSYSIPYTWGITGIIYNKELLNVGDVVDSWDILWNDDYKGEILMFSNSRDAFGIVQKREGFSLNTQDPKELLICLNELKAQKPLVQAYVMDEIFDKMIGGEATLAPYYAGDAITMMEDNPNLAFAIPKEGVNIFVDAAVIPATSPNPEIAHMYLNFLMEPAVAAANSDYIGYATPNIAAKELLDEEITSSPIAYPPNEVLEKAEYFLSPSRETNLIIDDYWTELLTDDQSYNKLFVPVMMFLGITFAVGINIFRAVGKRKKHYI